MTSTTNLKRRSLLVGGAAAGSLASWPLILSSAHAQKKAEFTMILGHSFTPASEKYIVTGLEQFKQLAEKYSGGRLLVDVYSGNVLGDQNVMPQKVQQGVMQATQVSMQNFTQFSPSYNVLDFPYLFDGSAEKFEKFLEHPYLMQSALAQEPEAKGMKVLPGMWASLGMRQLCVSKKKGTEVHRPADLKGLKIRVTASKVEQQAFALTPGSPVSVNWGETYQALQQGACDALNVAIGALTAFRINETLGTCTFIEMSPNAHVTVVNKKWYDGLPSAVREAIDRAALESWALQKAAQKKTNERLVGEWKAAGIKIVYITPDERKEWIAAVGHQRPEWKEWRERYGKDLYRKIADIVGTMT